MILLLSISTLVYVLFCLGIAWSLLSRRKVTQSFHSPWISVIIAMRNEENSIEDCLTALQQQDYPHFEILLVDDFSEDHSWTMAEKWMQKFPQLKLLKNQSYSQLAGKKAALTTGIRQAQGEWLLFTDADCFPPPTWISGMVKQMNTANFLVGISPHQMQRKWHVFRELERIAVDAVAAAMIRWNIGLTCTGRNLAYKRELFEQLNGFEAIAQVLSGDDDLFILQATQSKRAQFSFVFDAATHVPTVAPQSWQEAYRQERRRTSKFGLYPWWLFAFTLPVVVFYFVFTIVCFLAAIQHLPWQIPATVLSIKICADFAFLLPFTMRSQQTRFLWILPLAEILHIPYLIIFSLLGLFPKSIWKGRS